MNIKKQTRILILGIVFTLLFPNTASSVYTEGPSNNNYNRTNAAQYIYNYTITPNSAYFDYTRCGGDCTNFISQVLAAGKMPMTNSVTNPTTNDWYYYGSNWGKERTATWTNAHSFSYYWIDINNIGAKKAYAYQKYFASDFCKNSTWQSIYSYLEPGDIIQYMSPLNYGTYHSQAVHRTSYEYGEFKVSVGQHTKNGWENLRNYISALPGNTIVCLIKIKEPPSTGTSYLGSYSEKTVAELESTQEYLFNFIPSTETLENEKWSKLSAIKKELIKRANNGDGIKEYVVPISKHVLTDIINIRMENNNNIINSISYNTGSSKQNIQIILGRQKENEALITFLITVSAVDEHEKNSVNLLWNEYWHTIVKQMPPPYYL